MTIAYRIALAFMLIMICTATPVMGMKHIIQIGDNFFSPLNTTVMVGDTVRWEWVGSFPHTTTSTIDSPKSWDSGILTGTGNSFEIIITAVDGSGPFPYLCTVHAFSMKDTIFVAVDTDGDGIIDDDEILIGTNPNLADSDSDGVDDLTEVGDVGSPTDTDNDLIIDALDSDDDGDNVPTHVELPIGDTDNDGTANYLDPDDDNDGVLTIDEDANSNGDPTDDDSDGDMIPDYLDDTFDGGCCISPTGNVDIDPSINDILDISDLLYLVDFFFAAPPGPPPVCSEEADVNGSGLLDISDLLYLVDFFFASPAGPSPQPCL